MSDNLKDTKNNDFNIYSPAYIRAFLQENYPRKKVESVIPYSFTVGSNNNGENLPNEFKLQNSLFYGYLYLNINPNDAELQTEKIEIIYRSYFNVEPFYKRITRFIEDENYINENSNSIELFDDLQITQKSDKYDFYLTFVGYKIDVL